ncbi:MAG: hypothetical protein H0U70_02220 [Tatlockia sp.]|nr:hypothetical protein [Tatlockia sp.]
MQTKYPPHSLIKEILPNIFFVKGNNVYVDANGEQQQHSRNMIIVRESNNLHLINTVQLTEEGLKTLDSLGKVKSIIRIGAFHDRDDGFYLRQYNNATLWAIPGMKHAHDHPTNFELTLNGPKPFPTCSVFIFDNSKEPEGILHINQDKGILITCDSIKNWVAADEFFSEKTAKAYKIAGFFGKASVSSVWRNYCQVSLSDFMQLNQFDFAHLLSAHGEPLLNIDKSQLLKSIQTQYDKSNINL